MSRRKAFFAELKARRAGRRAMQNDRSRTDTMARARVTRDVTGPTGWVFSNAWDKLDQHGDAYAKSFDRKIPPSLFVSERDRTRFGQPMPLVERCIEDAATQTDADRAAEIAATNQVPAARFQPEESAASSTPGSDQ